MKIKIEIDDSLGEKEIMIRCPSIDGEVQEMEQAIRDILQKSKRFVFFKGETEFYLPLQKILFFETSEGSIHAHTADEVYQTKYKLYELEESLPGCFMRISKSTILNTEHIYSITRNLTASSIVEFFHSHKQVFVSRYYYKPLKFKLEEKRKEYETSKS